MIRVAVALDVDGWGAFSELDEEDESERSSKLRRVGSCGSTVAVFVVLNNFFFKVLKNFN